MSLVNIESVHGMVLPGGAYQVRERGYAAQELTVEGYKLSWLLKTLIKREFPRSRKVRLVKISCPEELDLPKNRI